MTDEGFLKRWSRRKRAEPPGERTPGDRASQLQSPSPQAGEDSAPPPSRGAGNLEAAAPAKPQEEESIDPATLPPLESLGPDSDYTVFLRKGVPEALRIAALRKAWVSDPFIRDFRGPAEYALDYTAPEFNLRPGDDVAKMLERIFSPGAAQPVPETSAPSPGTDPRPAVSDQRLAGSDPRPAGIGAGEIVPQQPAPETLPPPLADLPQKEAERTSLPTRANSEAEKIQSSRRKHGGALPD